MKTRIYLFALLLLTFSSCSRTDNSFYNKVLGDFSNKSYFIALDIRSNDYKGRVIIENNDLYKCLNETKGWDKTIYHSKLLKILVHRRTLNVEKTDLIKWKFIKVKDVNNVYFRASKGVNSFIADYFNGTLFKYNVNEEEMYAVINQLFYWKIPVRFDSITGELILDN